MGFLALSEIIPPGSVFPYAGASAPSGWLICDGSAVSRTTYAGLFAVLSTSHGSGDGSTTFNLPDYRWTFLRGMGSNISVTGSGTASSNQATFTAHGFNRTGVKARLSSGTLSGLAASTDYWIIVVDANTLAFATSKANAIAGTRTAISGANSAVIVQYEDPDAASRAANTVGGNSAANIGSTQADQMQGHKHVIDKYGMGYGAGSFDGTWGRADANSPAYGWTYSVGNPSNDTINGAPRTGAETRPQNVYVNYIVKV
jgi:microcystin-dependent protein